MGTVQPFAAFSRKLPAVKPGQESTLRRRGPALILPVVLMLALASVPAPVQAAASPMTHPMTSTPIPPSTPPSRVTTLPLHEAVANGRLDALRAALA